MSKKTRIYILVKTYPAISEKYNELVCTAGILESGEWIRLYPIRFRTLSETEKYKKFCWVEVEIERNSSDFRPETYRPIGEFHIEPQSNTVDWNSRNNIIFKNTPVYTSIDKLVQDSRSEKGTSLAIFKPTKICSISAKATDKEWDSKKLKALQEKEAQMDLFMSPEEVREQFRVVRKVPYDFSYKIEDETGRVSNMIITDWEIGMLYFNCLKSSNYDEKEAIKKVKEKYLGFASSKDVYLFLGTTKSYHKRALNPFIIIGVYYPPKIQKGSFQQSLFDQENFQ